MTYRMKNGGLTIVCCCLAILTRCSSFDSSEIYTNLMQHADQVKVINTHEHQHLPAEYGDFTFGFYQLLAFSYLSADLVSAGANPGEWRKSGMSDEDALWGYYGKYLDRTRNTSYYSQFLTGFRELYGFREPYFTKENLKELNSEIEKNYENYPEWFDKAFRKSGFELMITDQYWKPLNTEIDTSHFALAFNINFMIEAARRRPVRMPGTRDGTPSAGKISLEQYLLFCDELFRKNIEKKAVCIKNSQAYSRTLFYEEVNYEEARLLFEKQELIPAEAKKLEDFMFHWIIGKAAGYNLPVQIHTGYLAGNGSMLENADPLLLNNLFLKYPDARFVLFHGGFPWTGECAALAKMFPNVFLDLVWLPQISRQQAVSALDMMFDCVPYSKFCWGGDSHLIEESVGALESGKDVVCEVLANRVKRGLMTEKVAKEVLDAVFRENAVEIFGLKVTKVTRVTSD